MLFAQEKTLRTLRESFLFLWDRIAVIEPRNREVRRLWYTLIMASQRHKQRTYARNRVFSRRGNEKFEPDGVYLLKLVTVTIAGTLWLKFKVPLDIGSLTLSAFPLGLIGGALAVYLWEKRPGNRHIWYAILLIVAIVSYFLPAGILLWQPIKVYT